MRLKRFLLRYYPPGITLEYEHSNGTPDSKTIDLLTLSPEYVPSINQRRNVTSTARTWMSSQPKLSGKRHWFLRPENRKWRSFWRSWWSGWLAIVNNFSTFSRCFGLIFYHWQIVLSTNLGTSVLRAKSVDALPNPPQIHYGVIRQNVQSLGHYDRSFCHLFFFHFLFLSLQVMSYFPLRGTRMLFMPLPSTILLGLPPHIVQGMGGSRTGHGTWGEGSHPFFTLF